MSPDARVDEYHARPGGTSITSENTKVRTLCYLKASTQPDNSEVFSSQPDPQIRKCSSVCAIVMEREIPDYFLRPPKIRELGEACGQSYWAVRRLVLAGVAPRVLFPDGDHVATEWANRYRERGLTDAETQQYKAFMRRRRSPQAQPGGLSAPEVE